MIININSDALVQLSNSLERINKSAFPMAVRETLNSAAFDVKKRTLLLSSERNFVKRQPNFFRANSRVEMAQGWELRGMKALIGMVDLGGNNYAVDDLQQQEHGGDIDGKSFIPTDQARGGSNKKLVQRKNRLSQIKRVRNIDKIAGRVGGKYIFRRMVYKAGVGAHVIYKNMLWRIDSLAGKDIKMTALYTFRKGRSVSVKSTNFMKEATLDSAKRIDDFYLIAAEKQFERQLRKFW